MSGPLKTWKDLVLLVEALVRVYASGPVTELVLDVWISVLVVVVTNAL